LIPGDFQLKRRPDKKRLALAGLAGLIGLAGLVGTVLVVTFVISAWFGRPVVFGFDEGPTQPIAFPHTVHAGVGPLLNEDGSARLDSQGQPMNGLGLDCTFCHRDVTSEAAATIPAVGLCMSCHVTVGDDNPEVEKLREIAEAGRPIDWVRVHRVPDHVHFVHEAHVRAFSGSKEIVEKLSDRQTEIRIDEARRIDPAAAVGQTIEVAESQVCAICHGDVASMPKVEQVRPLKMADCVNCHRDNEAPTDCTTCHY
jgi:hypothetical protein